VIGAVWLAARSRRGHRPRRAFPVLVGFALCHIVLALHVPYALALLLIGVTGALMVGGLNRMFAVILASVPDRFRGRISSIHMLCFMTGFPLGSLVGGVLADRIGMLAVFAVFGTAMLLGVGIIYWVTQALGVEFQDGAAAPSAAPAGPEEESRDGMTP